MIKYFAQETPCGLQGIFHEIVDFELAWRGEKSTNCILPYFKEDPNKQKKSSKAFTLEEYKTMIKSPGEETIFQF